MSAHKASAETPRPLCYCGNTVTQLSQKLRIFTVALDWTKRATWNGSYPRLSFTYINTFFTKLCAKNEFHISTPSDLELLPVNLNITLPVTADVDLSLNVVRLSIFKLSVSTGHMDSIMCMWPPRGGLPNNVGISRDQPNS